MGEEKTAKIGVIQKWLPYILIIIGVLLLYNIYNLWATMHTINIAVAELQEAAIPLDIKMTIITASICEDCYDIHSIIPSIGKFNVNITEQKELESDDDEAKILIAQYGIQKIPALIVTTTVESAEKKQDVVAQLEKILTKEGETAFVYKNTNPPYLDVASGKIKGRVTVVSLTSDCDNCQNISSMIPALKKIMAITNVKEVAYGTAEAQDFIEKYNLKFVPTIIISSDAEEYEGFAETWQKYGTEEKDGSFILRNTIPPYVNTTTGEIVGLVDIIYLIDASCEDCYDVMIHKQILQGFGMRFAKETTVDINTEQGQALLEKYGITKVPTIILSKDAAAYAVLGQLWSNVGVVADDDSYIFTEMNQLQGATFTDLSKEHDFAEKINGEADVQKV